jgi:hypothetical protein
MEKKVRFLLTILMFTPFYSTSLVINVKNKTEKILQLTFSFASGQSDCLINIQKLYPYGVLTLQMGHCCIDSVAITDLTQATHAQQQFLFGTNVIIGSMNYASFSTPLVCDDQHFVIFENSNGFDVRVGVE